MTPSLFGEAQLALCQPALFYSGPAHPGSTSPFNRRINSLLNMMDGHGDQQGTSVLWQGTGGYLCVCVESWMPPPLASLWGRHRVPRSKGLQVSASSWAMTCTLCDPKSHPRWRLLKSVKFCLVCSCGHANGIAPSAEALSGSSLAQVNCFARHVFPCSPGLEIWDGAAANGHRNAGVSGMRNRHLVHMGLRLAAMISL